MNIENNSKEPFHIAEGDRIAQAGFRLIPEISWNEVNELDETERNENGFGSSGVN